MEQVVQLCRTRMLRPHGAGSTNIHATSDVSVAAPLIPKLVPATRLDTYTTPNGTPPTACADRKMRLLAVTAFVAISTSVAPFNVAVPIFAFEPSLICKPFPAVPATMFPAVTVVSPDSAVAGL